MPLSESDTMAKLIDPALHERGWTEDRIRREESAGTVYIVDGQPRRQAQGWVDYTLRLPVAPGAQDIAVALIEAKAEQYPPAHGLQQAKLYSSSRRPARPLRLFIQRTSIRGVRRLYRPDQPSDAHERVPVAC